MSDELSITQEDVNLAATQEENQRLQAQLKYLSERVVSLRALVNRQAEELNKLDAETKEDEDDRADD